MGTISLSLPSDGQTVDAADVNTPLNTIAAEFNGNIDNANIKSGAAIDGSKIASTSLTSAQMATSVSPVTRWDEGLFDFVASGGVWSGDAYASTLNASMTALVGYIDGVRGTVSAVTARAFTASKDTYIDVLNTAGTFSLAYTEVTNNAASPALAANSIRLGIIITDATDIQDAGSVNQGQETKVLPIASSIPYAVTDSLGNLICSRDPNRRTLGYRQIIASVSSSGTGNTATNMQCPVNVPTGRKVKITTYASRFANSGASQSNVIIFTGAGVGGTELQKWSVDPYTGTASVPVNIGQLYSPAAGAQSFSTGVQAPAGTATITASAANPAYILVELV